MPSYRGVAHHALSSATCCSKSAFSAAMSQVLYGMIDAFEMRYLWRFPLIGRKEADVSAVDRGQGDAGRRTEGGGRRGEERRKPGSAEGRRRRRRLTHADGQTRQRPDVERTQPRNAAPSIHPCRCVPSIDRPSRGSGDQADHVTAHDLGRRADGPRSRSRARPQVSVVDPVRVSRWRVRS